jgi:hypothetical protein
MSSARCAAIALLLITATARTAAAQQTVADVLSFLVTNQSVATGSPAQDVAAAQATSDTISRALLANLATLPVSSSSGAFVYRLNPELGTVERATSSFGPFFVERALTAGEGRSSFGVTFQHLRFTSLDGRSLRDGSLVTTANQFVDEAAPFDVDRLALDIDASVATLYGTVGLTDRLDVGFAIPAVRLTVDGTRVNTYRGRTFTQARATATAVGLADVVARTRYSVYEEDGLGLAAAADLRLPTGRREDLLGAGRASLKVAGIGSIERGRAAGYVNLGLTVGGLAREVSYDAAATLAATGRLTLAAELLGRSIAGVGAIVPAAEPHPTLAGVETTRLVASDGSRLNLLSFVPGLKWNLTGTWVLVANAMLPLTHAGLTAPVTPFVGVEYGR